MTKRDYEQSLLEDCAAVGHLLGRRHKLAKSLLDAGVGTLVAAGSVRYTAESLEDLAKAFDILAANERERAPHERTQRQRQYVEGRAAAFEDAARMLRHTTLTKEQA